MPDLTNQAGYRLREGAEVSCREIIRFLGPLAVYGDSDRCLVGPHTIREAGENHLTFCSFLAEKALEAVGASRAGAILCREGLPNPEDLARDKCLLIVGNPRLAFIRCLNEFFVVREVRGIHPTAVVDPQAVLGAGVSVGPMAHIGPGACIGDGTIIEARACVWAGSQIGKNVYIQPGAVIGCKGQGFERNEAGEFEVFPQLGRVVLEDEVEIGANATIVRGALTETRIGAGTKVGHLASIGHNVVVGRHVFISACVQLSGQVSVGDFAWLSPGCSVLNRVRIGRNATVGFGAVVVKDVPEGQTFVGVPARRIK